MRTMTMEEYSVSREESLGICLACGNRQGGCEPDARKYKCEDCGANRVFGIEEALMAGEVDIVEE